MATRSRLTAGFARLAAGAGLTAGFARLAARSRLAACRALRWDAGTGSTSYGQTAGHRCAGGGCRNLGTLGQLLTSVTFKDGGELWDFRLHQSCGHSVPHNGFAVSVSPPSHVRWLQPQLRCESLGRQVPVNGQGCHRPLESGRCGCCHFLGFATLFHVLLLDLRLRC